MKLKFTVSPAPSLPLALAMALAFAMTAKSAQWLLPGSVANGKSGSIPMNNYAKLVKESIDLDFKTQ